MVGVVVLAGWAFDIPLARSVVPGTISMKANTAISFVLAGIGLWLVAGIAIVAEGIETVAELETLRE